MGKVKGCINESCEAYQKKKHYKLDDKYCLKCGEPLIPVCKKCHVPLGPEDGKRCPRCEQVVKQKKDKIKAVPIAVVQKGPKVVAAAGGAAAAVGVVIKNGKEVAKIAKDVTKQVKKH